MRRLRGKLLIILTDSFKDPIVWTEMLADFSDASSFEEEEKQSSAGQPLMW